MSDEFNDLDILGITPELEDLEKGGIFPNKVAPPSMEGKARTVASTVMGVSPNQQRILGPAPIKPSLAKQKAKENVLIMACINTRQDQCAQFCKPRISREDRFTPGFEIRVKNEDFKVELLKKKLRQDRKARDAKLIKPDVLAAAPNETKAAKELLDWELAEEARAILADEFLERKEAAKNFLLNCGSVKNRPFESQQWSLERLIKVIVEEVMIHNVAVIERIFERGTGKLHHFVPVDRSTIRIVKQHIHPGNITTDQTISDAILEQRQEYQAKQISEEEESQYQYCQIYNDDDLKVYKVFTKDQLGWCPRLLTADIAANGYPVSPMQVIQLLLSSLENAEKANHVFHRRGVATPQVLQVVSDMPQGALEAFKNAISSQLTSSENAHRLAVVATAAEIKIHPLKVPEDSTFGSWIFYLIKMICSALQIDPQEIGFGLREDGGKSGLAGGDNTAEKLKYSLERGLAPLLQYLEGFINNEILTYFDPDVEFVFVGTKPGAETAALTLEEKEARYKLTVNEVRASSGLPPIPGMDTVILGPEGLEFYSKFSDDAKAVAAHNIEMQQRSQENMTRVAGEVTKERIKLEAKLDAAAAKQAEKATPDPTGKSEEPLKKAIPEVPEWNSEEAAELFEALVDRYNAIYTEMFKDVEEVLTGAGK